MQKRLFVVGDLDWLGPPRLIELQVGSGDRTTALLQQLDERPRNGASGDTRGALFGQRLKSSDEARQVDDIAGLEQLPIAAVEAIAFVQRVDGLERDEAICVGRG